MKLSVKLFVGFILISALFTAVAIVNFRLSEDVNENSDWVTRSQEVVRNSAALQRNIIDMETGIRGFLLNGNETFLKPYSQAKATMPELFNDLSEYTTYTTDQTQKLKYIFDVQKRWETDYAEPLVKKEKLYLARGNDLTKLEKDSYGVFSDKADKVKAYAKDKKLKLQKKEDAVKLVNYYATLK